MNIFTAPIVVERTIPMDSHDSISGSQNPPQVVKQGEQSSEEMDFEVVSLSEGEGRQMKRSSSYEEAVILENSSDFCNGLHAKSHDSSTHDSNCQPQDKSLNDVHDTDTLSRDSTVAAKKEMEEKQSLEKEIKSKMNVGNEEKDIPVQQRSIEMGIPSENAGTREITSSTMTSTDQPLEIDRNDASSSAANGQPLKIDRDVNTDEKVDTINNNQTVPQATDSRLQDSSHQNGGAKDEIKDSGTISTENFVYQPTWKDDEPATAGLVESMETLDVRKRKSPDREIPGDRKKRHVSENCSDDGGSGDEQVLIASGDEDEKNQSTDNEDEDDEEENSNADQTALKKKKKHCGQKKKKKAKYQKKKGQFANKPTNESETSFTEKSEVSNTPDNTMPELQKFENTKLEADKQAKIVDNENLKKKQGSVAKKKENRGSEDTGNDKPRNDTATRGTCESPQSSSSAPRSIPQNPVSQQPGGVNIPVVFSKGNGNSNEVSFLYIDKLLCLFLAY